VGVCRLYVAEWIYAFANAYVGGLVSSLFLGFTPLAGFALPLPTMVEYTKRTPLPTPPLHTYKQPDICCNFLKPDCCTLQYYLPVVAAAAVGVVVLVLIVLSLFD
jgi:hypothetical protein